MSDITTPEGRAELRELRTAGTPGEWVALGNSIGAEVGECTCVGGPEYGAHEQYCGLDGVLVLQADEADAKLIAAAVNALPALLDALDAACSRMIADENTIEELRAQVLAYQQLYERDLPGNSGTHGVVGLIQRAERAESALNQARKDLAWVLTERDSQDSWRKIAECELDRAEAALDRVRELHQPASDSCSALYPEPLCRGCGAAYPCDTVRALDGAQ